MWNEFLGEFLGTGLLVLLGNGMVANVSLAGSKGKDAGWVAITLGWAWPSPCQFMRPAT